jgi:tetratricopeptide (TPR) repeat protein
MAEPLESERRKADELYRELLQHPPARQQLLVANSHRFRSRVLAELLLMKCHEAGFQEPSRAVDLAALALAISETLSVAQCGSPEDYEGLRVRAWAQLGNARRICADHAGSERAFAQVSALLQQGRIGILDRARVLDQLVSLRRDQRRFAEAQELVGEVVSIYQRLGEWNLLGRALCQKASVCGEAGDLETEMALLRRALDLLDPEEEPRVFLVARHNLITVLNESGRSRDAFTLLFHTRPLYLRLGSRMDLLRMRWLEGDIALGLGRVEQAEAAFREVRQEYMDLGIDYDAALASLDLAACLIQQDRLADVRTLAEEMLTVFASRKIHREAMGAILFFCQAAKLEKAGTVLVREVADFLKNARNDHLLRFAPSA